MILRTIYFKALMNMPKTEFRTILIRQRILCDAHLELNPTLNIQKIGSAQVNFYLQYIHILFFLYTVYIKNTRLCTLKNLMFYTVQ